MYIYRLCRTVGIFTFEARAERRLVITAEACSRDSTAIILPPGVRGRESFMDE